MPSLGPQRTGPMDGSDVAQAQGGQTPRMFLLGLHRGGGQSQNQPVAEPSTWLWAMQSTPGSASLSFCSPAYASSPSWWTSKLRATGRSCWTRSGLTSWLRTGEWGQCPSLTLHPFFFLRMPRGSAYSVSSSVLGQGHRPHWGQTQHLLIQQHLSASPPTYVSRRH